MKRHPGLVVVFVVVVVAVLAIGCGGAHRGASPPAPGGEVVEGTLFMHCAYGPPGYGEDPQRDAPETFGVLVLDQAMPKVCAGEGADAQCALDVRMLELAPADTSRTHTVAPFDGQRVRVAVSAYMAAQTGHHHARMMLFYDKVDAAGASPHHALSEVWDTVADDFLGTSCQGFPR